MADVMGALRTALQQLEQERTTLDLQIAALRSVLGQPAAIPAQQQRVTIVRRRTMSAAARKVISQRMKAMWVKRRAAAQGQAKGK